MRRVRYHLAPDWTGRQCAALNECRLQRLTYVSESRMRPGCAILVFVSSVDVLASIPDLHSGLSFSPIEIQ